MQNNTLRQGLLIAAILLVLTTVVSAQTTAPMTDKDGNMGVGTIAPTAKLEIVAAAGQPGIKVGTGGVVLSYAAIASGGNAPVDKAVVFVNTTGSDGTSAVVTIPPAQGQDGQVVTITTNDPDGVTVNYTDPTGAVNFSASVGTTVQFFRAGGTWHVEY